MVASERMYDDLMPLHALSTARPFKQLLEGRHTHNVRLRPFSSAVPNQSANEVALCTEHSV